MKKETMSQTIAASYPTLPLTGMPDLDSMTTKQIKQLVSELHAKASKPAVLLKSGPVKSGEWFWKMGQGYHIRTGTHHYTGTFIGFNGPNNSEIIITDAAWIADDGRFSDAIKTGAGAPTRSVYEDRGLLVL